MDGERNFRQPEDLRRLQLSILDFEPSKESRQ